MLGEPALADPRLARHDQRAAAARSREPAQRPGDQGNRLLTADEDRTAHRLIVRSSDPAGAI
jgi:hypothetical protein